MEEIPTDAGSHVENLHDAAALLGLLLRNPSFFGRVIGEEATLFVSIL